MLWVRWTWKRRKNLGVDVFLWWNFSNHFSNLWVFNKIDLKQKLKLYISATVSGTISTICLIFSIVMVIASWFSIKGIKEVRNWTLDFEVFKIHFTFQRLHNKLQLLRILSLIGYFLAFSYIISIALSDDVKREVEKEFEQKYVMKFSKERFLDVLAHLVTTERISGISIIIAIDFFFRFLVIEALYHKFKNEKKPHGDFCDV